MCSRVTLAISIIFLPALIFDSGFIASMSQGQLLGQAQSVNQDEVQVEGSRLLTPRSYGFEFDPGYPRYFEETNVRVRNTKGDSVVAKLICRVGDNSVVMMPNGQLESRAWADVALVEDKFKATKKQEIAKQLQSGRFANFNVSTTRNFVFVYNTSDGFVNVTKRILESMRKGVLKQLDKAGFEANEPDVPLVVIMFADKDQFQAYKTMPEGVLAYYNMVSNHVVLYEPAPRRGVRLDVIQGQALSTIAHEGAHQLLHNTGIQQRLSLWPMWLSEGLAEYYAPTSFGKNFSWKGAGVINDLRMFELENYLQARELVGLDGSTITDCVSASRLDSTGYATAWSIVHYLAEHHQEKLVEYIKYISQLPPLRGMAGREAEIAANLDHFKKFFGEDFEAMEADLIEHLKAQNYDSPMSHIPHYVTVVQFQEDDKEVYRGCIYHRQELANQWRQQFFLTLNSEQRQSAKVESQAFDNRSKAVRYLGRFIK